MQLQNGRAMASLICFQAAKYGTLWWTNIAMENGPVEIVDFPIKNGDFPLQTVSSPEGKLICERITDGWFYSSSRVKFGLQPPTHGRVLRHSNVFMAGKTMP